MWTIRLVLHLGRVWDCENGSRWFFFRRVLRDWKRVCVSQSPQVLPPTVWLCERGFVPAQAWGDREKSRDPELQRLHEHRPSKEWEDKSRYVCTKLDIAISLSPFSRDPRAGQKLLPIVELLRTPCARTDDTESWK